MRPLLLIVLALALAPAASAAPRVQTISGTVTANSGSSLTVTSADRSLTCLATGARAQAALAHWGTGVRVAMACRQDGSRLRLDRLTRLGAKEGSGGTTTTTTTTTTSTTTATAPPEPAHTTPAPSPTPPPPPPSPERRQAIGIVTALSGDSVTVKPGVGDSLRCRITPASDSAAAAAKLSLGAHVDIVCRPDGTTFVLAGATSAG